jgi:hypothetical protein
VRAQGEGIPVAATQKEEVFALICVGESSDDDRGIRRARFLHGGSGIPPVIEDDIDVFPRNRSHAFQRRHDV